MSLPMLKHVSRAFSKIDSSLEAFVARILHPGGPGFSFAGIESLPHPPPPSTWQRVSDLWETSVLAGVPKHRRSIEKRLTKRFGSIEYVYKMLFMKKNLQTCMTCGHFHEPGVLCPHCYHKVVEETKAISDKIQETLKLEPIEKDVIVLYEGDKVSPEFYEGKRIVEMQKPRPPWFSSNLLQPSTEEPNDKVKDLKPNELA